MSDQGLRYLEDKFKALEGCQEAWFGDLEADCVVGGEHWVDEAAHSREHADDSNHVPGHLPEPWWKLDQLG